MNSRFPIRFSERILLSLKIKKEFKGLERRLIISYFVGTMQKTRGWTSVQKCTVFFIIIKHHCTENPLVSPLLGKFLCTHRHKHGEQTKIFKVSQPEDNWQKGYYIRVVNSPIDSIHRKTERAGVSLKHSIDQKGMGVEGKYWVVSIHS